MKPFIIAGHGALVLVFALTEEQAVNDYKNKYPGFAAGIYSVELAPEGATYFLDYVDYDCN